MSRSPRSEPTFIERARRAQILDAAVAELAENGWFNTSLASIATRIGISKGVISYHYRSKDELMEAVVGLVYAGILDRMLPQLEGLPPLERVRRHVHLLAQDVREHATQVAALGQVVQHMTTADGRLRWSMRDNEPYYRILEASFAEGQRTGALRAFDTRVMAITMLAALDAMVVWCATEPTASLDSYAPELAEILVNAMANPSGAHLLTRPDPPDVRPGTQTATPDRKEGS
jgi:AcrR family transcriptional regulator